MNKRTILECLQPKVLIGWLTPGIIAALVILALFTVPWAQVDVLLAPESVMAAEGDTNFTNVVLSGDLTVTDDVTITDGLTVAGATTLAGVITAPIDTNHVGLPSIQSTVITTDTTNVFTVGATEVWFITALYCNVTTNFDCTGDNCTLIIGDGNDTNGFLILTDAEMQAADAEITGATAGWKGQHSDSVGAYLAHASANGFVYTNDGIDADFGGTGVENGSMTCYVVYTRIQ